MKTAGIDQNANIMAKEIVATEIINDMVHVEYEDGTKEEKPLIKIKDRKKAYNCCKFFTCQQMALASGFDNLHKFYNGSDYERMRNYELEDYLHFLTGGFWAIVEKCPFNGFSTLD